MCACVSVCSPGLQEMRVSAGALQHGRAASVAFGFSRLLNAKGKRLQIINRKQGAKIRHFDVFKIMYEL